MLQAGRNNAGDGLLGGLSDTLDADAAPELRRADELRPLDGLEVVELRGEARALVVAFLPQGFKDVQQRRFLLGPVDQAQGEAGHQALPLCFREGRPGRRALLRGVFAVRVIARDGGHQNVPHAPVVLRGAAHGLAHSAALLPQVLEGRNLEFVGLVPLRLQ